MDQRGGTVRFLHITDCHLGANEVVRAADAKSRVAGMDPKAREQVLSETLAKLCETMGERGELLDGVLFTGDGTMRGDPEGLMRLREIVLEKLKPLGIGPEKIVATPGNHDVVRGTEPSKPERYKLFMDAWLGKAPVICPFLDGTREQIDVLADGETSWAVFPINSANWCQLEFTDDYYPGLAPLRKAAEECGQSKLLSELSSHDIARISDQQLDALREAVEKHNPSLRIAVLHHHTLHVGSREEFKTFADITNLGHLRQVLRELKFDIVIHGHKHETALAYDHIYDSDDLGAPARRILTISGGTFGSEASRHDEVMRLIEIKNVRFAPYCKVIPIPLASAGRQLRYGRKSRAPVWEEGTRGRGPLVIQSDSVDDLYERVIQAAETNIERSIICTLDHSGAHLPIPETYPHSHEKREDLTTWFQETVDWWQQPTSLNQSSIPYIHGSRLRRQGGWFDQIERAVSAIRTQTDTSKAIAVLIEPARDLAAGNRFASFCFVQFFSLDRKRLDCIGYYRNQEFRHWWPVNVAELRYLQAEVSEKVGLKPGLITTITAVPRLGEVRQPTKAAVPLIDQWLDSHPDRIGKIAIALVDSSTDHQEGIALWRRCIKDMKEATEQYHQDGVPTAIKGLELLAKMVMGAGGSPRLLKALEDLLDANESLPSNPTRKDFDRWKKRVTPLLDALHKKG